MVSTKKNINSLFNLDTQYEVPRYQRRYVWGKTNWLTLWEDILYQIKQKEQNKDKPNLRHFTGLIVVRSIDSPRGMWERFEVIDGQQRFTTFQIILCIIRDLLKLAEPPDQAAINAAEIVDKLIVNPSGLDMNNSSDDVYKFVPTDYDKPLFRVVAEGKYGEVISHVFNDQPDLPMRKILNRARAQSFDEPEKERFSIVDAYDYFYEFIWTLIWIHTSKSHNYKKLDSLYQIIRYQFDFVQIELDESEPSEKIFESLNATGRMLSNFDYLRNNLFLRARELGENKMKEKFYRDIYYDKYWIFEKGWNAPKLEAFLKAFLMATWDPKCFKKENAEPFETFEKYQEYSNSLDSKYPMDEQKIPYEFEQLSKWAKSYQDLKDDPDYGLYVKFCKNLNYDYPDLDSFLLFVKHVNADELSDVIWILESYIVRRMLVLENTTCHHSQIKKESYNNIVFFFSSLVTKGCPFNMQSFVTFLNETCPNDDQVMDAFQEVASRNANFIEYVFRKIKEWEKEKKRYSVNKLQPLNWSMHVELSTEIQGRLEAPDQLNDAFNEIWPLLFYFNR